MVEHIPAAAMVLVASLTAAPWNPRTIKDPRFQNLCESLNADPDFLRLRPILATADGTVFAGNMRLRAAQHLGWTEVPAILVDIPEQLAKERAMRDNAQWGEWEEDDLAKLLAELREQGSNLDLLGFDDRDLRNLLDRIGSEGGLTDPDDAPPLPEDPVTQPGDLWLLGDHRLLCGDSTNAHDVTFLFKGEEKAGLLVTDPPYLVNYDGANRPPPPGRARPEKQENAWDEFQGSEAAIQFYVDFLEASFPHLTERAPFYQWHANLRQGEVNRAWERAGLLSHVVIIWVKTKGVFGRNHFMWKHEPCVYGWRQGSMPRLKPPSTETSVWHVEQKDSDTGHPTQKPVELFRRPMAWHLKQGQIAYDPFCGSGTALIAAELTGRRCYAMEQDPRWADVTVRRWKQYTGRTAERVPREKQKRKDLESVKDRLEAMGLGRVTL